jgi:D-cysteine desulfhydrase
MPATSQSHPTWPTWQDAPRIPLARLDTPIEPCPRLASELGVELWVKRDDLTGSHLSGNKVRKLEYLLAEARAEGATHVITCGGLQSNHCRATALAAAPLGLSAVLLLRTPTGDLGEIPDPPDGNLLLDRLAGARIHPVSPAGYAERAERMAALAAEIAHAGGKATLIPEGGSNACGSLGYVRAVAEIAAQMEDRPPTSIVVAAGSGGTLAGVALGIQAHGLAGTRAIGIPVCDDAAYFRGIVQQIAAEAGARYGLPSLEDNHLALVDGHKGRGYALTTPEELRFLVEVARKDGLVLDPVYTNKAFRGLVALCRSRPALLGRRPLFIHTGGLFGLLAIGPELAPACA